MKILKFISQGILYFIALIIIAVVLALGTLFLYFSIQTFLFGRGDYLLFISGHANMIPVYMIIVLIGYVAFMIKEKLVKRKDEQMDLLEEYEEPLDVEQLSKKEQTILTIWNKLITGAHGDSSFYLQYMDI